MKSQDDIALPWKCKHSGGAEAKTKQNTRVRRPLVRPWRKVPFGGSPPPPPGVVFMRPLLSFPVSWGVREEEKGYRGGGRKEKVGEYPCVEKEEIPCSHRDLTPPC